MLGRSKVASTPGSLCVTGPENRTDFCNRHHTPQYLYTPSRVLGSRSRDLGGALLLVPGEDDFHWCHEKTPPLSWAHCRPPTALRQHLENQQDALQHKWDGHITGTDGGVQREKDLVPVGAGFEVGVDSADTVPT